jgi:hypothetical protein
MSTATVEVTKEKSPQAGELEGFQINNTLHGSSGMNISGSEAIEQDAGWEAHRVVVFHGQFDSHASEAPQLAHKYGHDYETATLGDVFGMKPASVDKSRAPAMIPSGYFAFNARTHDVQQKHGSFVALTGDIDEGSPSMDMVEQAVRGFAGNDVAVLIYSSSSATAEMKKWRVVIPLAKPCTFAQWEELQHVFFGFMEAQGLKMDWALARAAQPVYLPNVPAEKRTAEGEPIFHERLATNGGGLMPDHPVVAACLATLRENKAQADAAAEQARAKARAKKMERMASGDASPVDEFNKAYSIEEMMQRNGYTDGPRDNWRSPYQSSKTFATHNFGDYWVSLSQSDATAGLGTRCQKGGCWGDAFDLFCHFEHDGDFKKAVREASILLGLSKTSNKSIQPSVMDLEAAKRAQEARSAAVKASSAGEVDQVTGEGWSGPVVARHVFGVGQFMSEMTPKFWILQKVLAKGWLYALAASPGAGKTAVALLLTLRAAMGQQFMGRKVSKSKVLYLCGENPQDVRGRFDALLRRHSMTLADVEGQVFFTKSPFNIDDKQDLDAFIADAQQHDPFDLCIIDTQKAHSGAEDEDNNSESHELAQAMRRLGVGIGDPCILTLSHPTKTPTRDTLLPRGGSSFTGSIDGVLCLWKADRGAPSELFSHKDKFRGKAFEGEFFQLDEDEHPTLVDNFGDPDVTVVASEMTGHADISAIQRTVADSGNAIVLDKIREACLRGELRSKTEWASELGKKSDYLRVLNGLVTSGQLVGVPCPGALVGKRQELDVLVPQSVGVSDALRAAAVRRLAVPAIDEEVKKKIQGIVQSLDGATEK